MGIFRRKKKTELTNIPRHIAIIMDGNGRWAKKRGMPRTAGHAVGAENFRTIARCCKELGVSYLTVYAFSTENWKRPQKEVETIMGLLETYLQELIRDAEENGTRVVIFGDLSPLSLELQQLCEQAERATASFDRFQANICLNYGGRDELVRAFRACASEMLAEGRAPESIDEADITAHLYSASVPDPDLVIRPSGEIRISNFLLWQSAYSEYYFTDVLWPDFSRKELIAAIEAYQNRSRRFGGV